MSQHMVDQPARKPVGGGNSSNVPVTGGECTLTLTVFNTGQTTLKVDGNQTRLTPPGGWSVGDTTGTAVQPIAPGESGTLIAKLTASQAAVSGPVTGKIVVTDAS